jgi:thiol-disulfide isomerase/thioredoxin
MKPHDDLDVFVHDRLASLTPGPEWTPDAGSHLATMHARRAARARSRHRWTALALALMLVFASVPVTRAFGARCVEACVSATSRVAQWWTPAEPLANAPKAVGSTIGNLAPGLVGHDASGRPVSLADFRGRVVVVNFWATWCAPCRAEMPVLNDLQDRFGARGLQVLGVSLDENGWNAIDPFVAAVRVRYPIALGNDAVSASFGGVDELPATVVVDQAGVIVARMSGALRVAQYDELFDRLLR